MANILNHKKNMPKKSNEDHAEDALYREVWEEVNAQKLYSFLKKHAKYFIAGAILIVMLVIGFQLYQHNHKKELQKIANQFDIALINNDFNELKRLADRANSGTGDLAAFKSYLINKDVKTLEELAKNGNTRDFRDLAIIHLAGIKGDDMTAKEFKNFMHPLDTKKSPYYYNAALLVAQKYLSVGDNEHATKWLNKIDNDAPNIISATADTLK